ncbi:MAG: penicillin-binding transpeptidase domain-containing protein, partial [Actinomycetota bacterium]|nr:penicillin-binding transpeptidase domain-containing protein [Actinomycetota bacterium]
AVLAGPSTVVTVGLQGSAVKDPTAVVAAFAQAGISPAATAAALRSAAAHPDQFVAVTDLPDRRYQEVKPRIFPVAGTRFRTHAGRSTLTTDLAAHVVGSVGPITAEQLATLGAPYSATDSVGQGGLEAGFERQLAGTPGGTVKILDGTASVTATVATVAPKAGSPLQTTIDPHDQMAAEAALDTVTQPAALVAIRGSTGEVLAAVSRPVSVPFDRALEGRYPPGSTFKVVTSAALLGQGLTPNSPATCPQTLAVGGRTFHNFEGEAAANLSLQQAFAVSCNTAFIGLAASLPAQSLVSAAGQFGFGTDPKLGLPAFGGQVPLPSDQVEKVATAIGQGRVLASPLQMAVVAAAVDSGRVNAPALVVATPGANPAGGASLAPGVVASLRTMMLAVVTSGTGSAANLAGDPPVAGKTGTAEFGAATPPMTHAWFIGYRGDVAFAVLIEGGGVGARVAVPVAAKFLRGL